MFVLIFIFNTIIRKLDTVDNIRKFPSDDHVQKTKIYLL